MPRLVVGSIVLKKFLRDRRGNVAILSAFLITGLIGASGLTVEYGNALLNHMQDQRVADLAAVGGANVYNQTSSATAVTAAVANIATLNGLPSGDLTASVVSSPSGDGNQAVLVTVSTTAPLVLSRIIYSQASLPITVTAYAEMKAGAPGCIVALSTGGSGVTLSGGTAVTASGCAVDSNNTVSVPCGTTITTKNVGYDSSAVPSQPCSGIQPPSGATLSITKQLTADPLAGTTEVTGATGRLSTVGALTSPSGPTVSGGTAVTFRYSQSTTQAQLTADGCSGTFASNTWTVSCPAGGTYTFGAISLSGGITVNFATSSAGSSSTYNFNGQINDSGTALHFGPGKFNISGGVVSGGGSTTTFGAGTFNIGQSTTSCNSSSHYSICNTGTLMSLGGSSTASTFVLAGGIYNSGGETLVLGGTSVTATSTGNSFNIGTASNGDSFDMGGGAITMFADATGTGSLFQMAGNLNVSSGGGSCLWLGAANEHDINGFMSTAGGTTLGAGVYTVTKYVWLGANGGGDVTCGGSTVGMNGTNITLVIGGASVPSSGTCGTDAICVAAGYGHVNLVAPTSGNTEGLVVIGPTTGGTAGGNFAEGASSTNMSGAFYLPTGPVSLSGGASVGNGSGQCLEVFGSQVSLSGGSELASSCTIPGSNAPGGSTVALVQ